MLIFIVFNFPQLFFMSTKIYTSSHFSLCLVLIVMNCLSNYCETKRSFCFTSLEYKERLCLIKLYRVSSSVWLVAAAKIYSPNPCKTSNPVVSVIHIETLPSHSVRMQPAVTGPSSQPAYPRAPLGAPSPAVNCCAKLCSAQTLHSSLQFRLLAPTTATASPRCTKLFISLKRKINWNRRNWRR